MCDCVWQELPNQTGQVKGSVLVTECEPCKTRREEQAVTQANLHKYDSFSINEFVAYINAQMSVVQRAKLAPYLGAMKDYMAYRFDDAFKTPNFRDLRLLCDQLNTDGILTSEEYTVIKNELLRQNINLENF